MATTTGLVSGAMQTGQAATNVNTAGNPVDYSSLVQSLYKKNLGRDAEQAGIDYYNKQLQSGRTLDDLQNEFVSSAEYKTLNDKQAAVQGAKQYYAKKWEVDPGKQTVQGQISNLTDPNSQINQRAIAQSQQEASRRGLINSSIAGTAAQAAVLDKALPVAQQDAATYANSAQTNAAAENTAGQFNANAQNQFTLQDKATAAQQALQNSANQSAQTIAGWNNTSNQTIADKNNLSSQTIAGLNNASTEKINTGNNASNQLITGMNNASAQTVAGLQTSSAEKINNANNASAQQIAAANNVSSQTIANLNSNTQLALGNLDAQTKTNLQNIVSANSQLLQTNTSAANAASQLMASIASIQTNDKLDANSKQIAINNLIKTMKESLSTFAEISGIKTDLSKYFTTDTSTATTAGTTATNADGTNP